MIRSLLIFIVILIFPIYSNSQSINIKSYEQTLKEKFDQIIESKSDSEKIQINEQIIIEFVEALELQNSFNFNFDSINKLGKLISEDKKFKIYNWNIPLENKFNLYNGIIQVWNEKDHSYKIVLLKDKSKEIPNPEKAFLTPNVWYGALYYQIVKCEYKKTKYYLLIGWQGLNYFISRKVIDVMEIDKYGEITFGKSIFKVDDEKKKRIIFEFSARLSMVCRYDSKYNLIIFDHLSPSKSIYKDQYQYYGPDMTQDALIYNKGKWDYISDFDARNPKQKNKSNKK